MKLLRYYPSGRRKQAASAWLLTLAIVLGSVTAGHSATNDDDDRTEFSGVSVQDGQLAALVAPFVRSKRHAVDSGDDHRVDITDCAAAGDGCLYRLSHGRAWYEVSLQLVVDCNM